MSTAVQGKRLFSGGASQPSSGPRSLRQRIWRHVPPGLAHATAFRLLTSRHVRDLQVIIYPVVLGAVVLAWHLSDKSLLGLLGVSGAVIAWAYRDGSVRLGVVDLFACEISTLCRVATIIDSVGRNIARFKEGPPTGPITGESQESSMRRFTSQENYFPVFESNTRDLQALTATVVINIAEFYTYMKAVRDTSRALAQTKPGPADRGVPAPASRPRTTTTGDRPWHDTACDLIFMLFLGLESARKAIDSLVEFEPERAERTIVILISELKAFRFLLSQYPPNDVRHRRLILRNDIYVELERTLPAQVTDEAQREISRKPDRISQWRPAAELLDNLKECFRERLLPLSGSSPSA